MSPQKLKGKDYSSDVILQSNKKNKLIYQVRANTYDFWLSGQYGKYNSNIFLFHHLGPFPSKMMRCPWILCFDLLPLQYTDLTYFWMTQPRLKALNARTTFPFSPLYNTRLSGYFAPIFYFNCKHFIFVYIVKQKQRKKFPDL